jgi:cell wall-associated NlpC family hydrolase
MNIQAYIKLPYKDKGRGLDGVDCWGLVRLVYKDELGVDLPDHCDGYQSAEVVEGAAKMVSEEKAHWQEVDSREVTEGDVIVLRLAGHPVHLGVVIDSGRKLMLHVMKGSNSVVEKYTNLIWRHRVDGFFRYRGLHA